MIRILKKNELKRKEASHAKLKLGLTLIELTASWVLSSPLEHRGIEGME
jgi:hypothetical protein